MKRVTIAIAFAAAVIMIAGSMSTHARDDDRYYKDLYELKQLHAAFHNTVSHAGLDPAGALTKILALWTEDGTLKLLSTDKTYSGRGTQVPGMFECEDGGGTLCDLYVSAGAFQPGHNWVSLTPIFTETISLIDDKDANIYFQCIYFDITVSPPALKSNVTFGLPGQPGTGLARKVKVQGKDTWLLSYAEVETVATSPGPPPVFDVPY